MQEEILFKEIMEALKKRGDEILTLMKENFKLQKEIDRLQLKIELREIDDKYTKIDKMEGNEISNLINLELADS